MKKIIYIVLFALIVARCQSDDKKEDVKINKVDEETTYVNSNVSEAIVKHNEEFSTVEADELHGRGIEKVYRNRFEEAKELFLEALEIEPQNTTILNSLGNCERTSRNPDKAIYFYNKAIASDSLYFNTYLNLALTCGDMEEFELGRIACKYVIDNSQVNKDIGIAYYNRSVLNLQDDNCEEALFDIKKSKEYFESVDLINSANNFQERIEIICY